LRDAGFIQTQSTFGADGNFVSVSVVKEDGPHPDFDSAFPASGDPIALLLT
jgi:hypothetical protein